MKVVYDVVGILALLGGLVLFGLALYTPTKFDLTSASAIQVSEVYNQATYYGMLAIAAFAFAIAVFTANKDE